MSDVRVIFRTLALLGFLSVFVACTSSTPQPIATVTLTPPPPTSTPAPTATPTITPSPTAMPQGKGAHYTLMALIDYGGHTLSIAQGIEYRNRSKDALAELVLAVQPNLWGDCFYLLSLRADREIASHHLEGQVLTVSFTTPLLQDETVIITLNYFISLPPVEQGNDHPARELIFGYTPRQINLVNWYPYVVPYRTDHGWLLHEPGVVGEHLVYDQADFDLVILFTDYADMPFIAAPGQGTWSGNSWYYQITDTRTLALSLSREYSMVSADVAGVKVSSVFFEENAKAGLAVLDTASRALQVFSERFAPYPHSSLTIVQGDFIPSMEYDGLIFIGQPNYHDPGGTARDFQVVLTAHEVAHQWWFGLVGNDQALEPWLDEALATYSERIFYESVAPDDVTWWLEQRLYAQPDLSGWVDTTIYDFNRPYTDVVYLRGARFLDELRQEVGDDAFFAFLQDYARTYSGQIATSADFFRILRRHTSADLAVIIGRYFALSH